MREKLYQIADLLVEMDATGRTARQGAAYAAPVGCGPVDFAVNCDAQWVMDAYPEIQSEDDAQYAGSGALFARKLLDHQGFQLHASAVVYQDRAYLFSGQSGIGKSTHTKKWERLFHAEIINDDTPALRYLGDTWYAYGTPWSGSGPNINRKAVLGGVAFLKRGAENHIKPIFAAEALPLLLSQTQRALPPKRMEQLLILLEQLLQKVHIWQLTCRNDDEAAYLSKRFMTGAYRLYADD